MIPLSVSEISALYIFCVVVVVYCLKYKVHIKLLETASLLSQLELEYVKPPLYDGPNVDEARYVAQTVSEMVLV